MLTVYNVDVIFCLLGNIKRKILEIKKLNENFAHHQHMKFIIKKKLYYTTMSNLFYNRFYLKLLKVILNYFLTLEIAMEKAKIPITAKTTNYKSKHFGKKRLLHKLL